MPELPEVETVRRMLARHVVGRRIRALFRSALPLRGRPVPRGTSLRVRGRAVREVRRHGKYLMIDLERGLSILSHLGMSGRWLFHEEPPSKRTRHVHVRMSFEDGSELWFEDARRFGAFRLVPTASLPADPALAPLGADPFLEPPDGSELHRLAGRSRVSAKAFLLDQRRLAGIGNIYASEILHRARVHPGRPVARLKPAEWDRIAAEIRAVLAEAVERMGTTFSAYRTLWNEPGAYGERLLVYDRADEPCRRCRTPVRRIVQNGRSTFFCPRCQPAKAM